jgi:hypothetical protein
MSNRRFTLLTNAFSRKAVCSTSSFGHDAMPRPPNDSFDDCCKSLQYVPNVVVTGKLRSYTNFSARLNTTGKADI